MKPAAQKELPARVPKQWGDAQDEPRHNPGHTATCRDSEEGESTHFGDLIHLKQEHTLRIGFQNIGGISATKNKIKDDIIRCGIEKYEFDIFGLAEVILTGHMCQKLIA
jgi:hypothetical protein